MTTGGRVTDDDLRKVELFESLKGDFRKFINEWSFYHMKTIRDEGLPLSQFFLLRHLHSFQTMDLTTITNFLGVTKPTVTGLIDTLEKDGFVKRNHDEEDRRRITISLTGKSEELFNRLESDTLSLFGDVFLSIPEDVILKLHETIVKMTGRIRENIEHEPDQAGNRCDSND